MRHQELRKEKPASTHTSCAVRVVAGVAGDLRSYSLAAWMSTASKRASVIATRAAIANSTVRRAMSASASAGVQAPTPRAAFRKYMRPGPEPSIPVPCAVASLPSCAPHGAARYPACVSCTHTAPPAACTALVSSARRAATPSSVRTRSEGVARPLADTATCATTVMPTPALASLSCRRVVSSRHATRHNAGH